MIRHHSHIGFSTDAFNQGAAANRRPAGQLSGSGNLTAIIAADRAFPAAVAELGSFRFTRMGIFIIIIFLALSSWTLVALFRRLRRQRATAGRWLAFGILVALGLAVGIWCAFYVEYHVGSRYRIGSFPIPIVFFHLEDGQWVDFPVPEFQAWAAVFTNVITITALATLPVWLVSWRQHGHESARNAA